MKQENLHQLINACIERNIPFTSYRLPKTGDLVSIIQTSGKFQMVEKFEEVSNLSGFVYAPFHRKTNYPVVFFEPEITITGNNIDDTFIENIKNSEPLYGKYELPRPVEVTKEQYLKQAGKFISSFDKVFSKAVLSRILRVQKEDNFSTGEFFLNLTDKYPNAFVHIINIPGSGLWCGATPETLLSTNGEIAQTVSLAATRLAGDDNWTEKELKEQSIVTEFLEKVMLDFGIDNYNKHLTENLTAGHLIHLATLFEFEKSRTSKHLGKFLESLHPTPAVAGYPKTKALDLIFETEIHNREYYTGFCGPLNFTSETNLFVNLRCMKITDESLAIYTGGGLTIGSDPEQEWLETQRKAQTLLSLL